MEKIKQFIESDKGKDLMIVVIVILVGLGSFELGRLSIQKSSSGIQIEYPNENTNQEANAILSQNSLQAFSKASSTVQNSAISASKAFFASNRGSKYYPVGCSAGNNLKVENRIYFDTREEAERAGYELSSSCR